MKRILLGFVIGIVVGVVMLITFSVGTQTRCITLRGGNLEQKLAWIQRALEYGWVVERDSSSSPMRIVCLRKPLYARIP